MLTSAFLALAVFFLLNAILMPDWGSTQFWYLLCAAVFASMATSGLLRKFQRRE